MHYSWIEALDEAGVTRGQHDKKVMRKITDLAFKPLQVGGDGVSQKVVQKVVARAHDAVCSLLTTHYSLLTTSYSLLTARYSLLTTHCSLLTAHCSLLTTYYSL